MSEKGDGNDTLRDETRVSAIDFNSGESLFDFHQRGSIDRRSLQVPSNFPVLDIVRSDSTICDITIKGRSGHADHVSGTKPEPGESLEHLLKRLHPRLSDEQLKHEIKQVLKYNHDYGNDLGDGSRLDSDRAVFLTSVKTLDSNGHITRIEGPSGRVTEVSYGSDGKICGYRITAANGSLEEEACKSGDQWNVIRNGQRTMAKSVTIDAFGDLASTGLDGNVYSHLSNGTDLCTTYAQDRPAKTVAIRGSEEIALYEYAYEGSTTKIFVVDKNNPGQKILINQHDSAETIARLALAMGLGPQQDAPAAIVNRTNFDVPTDSYVSSLIVQSGVSLLGQAVTKYDATVPTNVGCARMVSQALVCAGFDRNIVDINVDNLEAKLKSYGFVPVSENNMLPGDIIIATGPGPKDGHTGIYTGNGEAMSNSSRRGVFATSSYQATFGGFTRRIAYRYTNQMT